MKNQIGLSSYFNFVDGVSQYLKPDFAYQARDVELGQWELPFEAILIELMKRPQCNIIFDRQLASKLAAEADIVDDGVLDVDTWKNFCKWAGIDLIET